MIWKRERLDRSDVELEQALTEPLVPSARVTLPTTPSTEKKGPAEAPRVTPPTHGPYTPVSPGKISTLGASLRIKGDLVADEDLVIQGQVEGSVLHMRSLTIGAQGRIQGEIRARRIIVQGSVDGNLYALESVILQSGASVRGDVFAPKVAIDEGARLSGRVDMDKAPTVPTVNLPALGQTEAGAAVATAQEVNDLLSGPLAERTSNIE
jgi:cytoskeletal protein CcmA (bactofilin family)